MSREALERVKTYSHPKVKGATRKCLDVIADQIPEGATMTPPLSIPELTTLMGYGDQAARRAVAVLVGAGVVRIVDGGQGKTGVYELLLLPGARGEPPALPLIGEAARRRRRRRPRLPHGPDLFEEPPLGDVAADGSSDQVATNSVHFVQSWSRYFGDFVQSWWRHSVHFVQSWWVRADHIGDFVQSYRVNSVQNVQSSRPLSSSRSVVVVDARARDPAEVFADAFLDWFEATYPTVHHGAACTVDRVKDGSRVRQLLYRPHTDVAHLQAMTLYLWAVTTDGVEQSDRWWIAERVTVRNIFVLHRKADFLDREVRRIEAPPTAPAEPPYDAVWQEILERIGTKVDRHTFHTWFVPLVMVTDHPTATGRVIEVTKNGPDGGLFVAWIQKHYAALVQAAVDEVRPGSRVEVIDAWALDEHDRREGTG